MILLKTIIFSLLVPGTVVGGVPYLLITRGPKLPAIGIDGLRWIGIAPFLGGLLLFLASARNFVLQGKGTPAPIDPPILLVTSGPYRFVRNPMYVGGILILLGESILCSSFLLLMYLGIIWLAFHLFIVFYEEPHLRKVRRWVPRVRKVAMP